MAAGSAGAIAAVRARGPGALLQLADATAGYQGGGQGEEGEGGKGEGL